MHDPASSLRLTDTRIVFQKPLHQHSNPRSQPSSSPLPSAIKTGFCNEAAPIAATLTDGFLDFSANRGLDLRKQGVGPGQRYCLEAARWKDALSGGVDEEGVPKVKLSSTHEAALGSVGMEQLKRWAAEGDVEKGVVWPGSRGAIRESGVIGGKEPKA